MANFKFKALDRNGTTVKGKIEARDEAAAYNIIQARRLDIFQISEVAPKSEVFTFNRKTKPKDHARYIRQLATLLSAGVTLLDALASLAKSNAHPFLANASEGIRKDLRSGERLSQAMEKHMPRLPRYVPRLAELGEATGQSAKALSDAADRMEFEDTMRNEVRTALSYPIFLTIIGSVIVFLLFLFVVPRFEALIGDNRDNMPAISRFVIGIGGSLKENLAGVLISLGLLIASGLYVFNHDGLRARTRTAMESFPFIGPVLVQSDLGGWARTVGIALDNGADLLSALRLGEFGIRSERLRQGFLAARTDIRAGRNIDEVLDENIPDFDPLTIDMIRTGRSSGGLANMLLFVGKTQEKETQELSKRLAALAEPIAILLISAIIGVIVISIVLAMTSLYDFNI